jgi:hypothetical protein
MPERRGKVLIVTVKGLLLGTLTQTLASEEKIIKGHPMGECKNYCRGW